MNLDMVKILQIQFNQCENLEPETHTITTKEFDKICRTCLATGDIRPIFEINYEEKTVLDLLKLHVSLQIFKNDNLPQNMCYNCLTDLFQMYSFIKKCHQADATLRCIINAVPNTTGLKQEDKFDLKEEQDPNITIDDHDLNWVDSLDEKDVDYSIKLEGKKVKSRYGRRRKMNVKLPPPSKINGPPFKCKICNQSYDDLESLRAHKKETKHSEARNHACSVCSKTFTSSKLRQHMRAHTKEKPYKCKVCFQGFSMSGNLKRHMMTHTGERPHVCEVCGKGFIQATTLQNHKKTHTKYERLGADANSPHFVCNCCGRGFKRLARYNSHLNKHYSESGDAKKAIQDDKPREHTCKICKRAYKTKHLLKAHLLTHGEKTFLCSDCGKGFVTKAALQSHLKVHTGEKPHTCNVCKKSFAHVGSFESHMLIHTGQKPYNCTICPKAFTQLSHLKYHLRTHSGEKPYICSYCGKSFALKGNLTVHVRTHTGETPYLCPVCGKGFYDSSSMKKHKRSHGENELPPPLQTMNISVGNMNVMDAMDCVNVNSMLI